MMNAASSYLKVYQVLDDVCFGGSVRPGAQGAIYAAIDGLRRHGAPHEHVRLVESIAVAVHKLQAAIQVQAADDVEIARAELQERGAEWLQMPMGMSAH